VLSIAAFEDLMSRIQAGDPDAAAELVRHYEPDIRLEVRVRLRIQDGRVRRMLDSMDITQSVLASFFAGVAVGQFAPQHPQQLLGLLVTMARNKLLSQVRHQRRQRPGRRSLRGSAGQPRVVANSSSAPLRASCGSCISMTSWTFRPEIERRQAWISI